MSQIEAFNMAQYETMLKREKPLKNYCKVKALGLCSKQRKCIVKRIEAINIEQEHPELTFYTAITILDKYLLSISEK